VDQFAALECATAGFAAILALVRAEQWSRPSINPGWSVRELVNHVVGGNRRYVVLLSGAPTAEVEKLRDLDHLGEDPVESFARTSAEVRGAFARPGALGAIVHHRKGDRTGADLLTMRVMEHALHGWDLARSIDVDAQIDPDVVATLLAALDADATLLPRSGYPPVDALPDHLEPQARLLALTGRSPTGSTSHP
jgi:uncharacterized protein (TIGR03086 family)